MSLFNKLIRHNEITRCCVSKFYHECETTLFSIFTSKYISIKISDI